jgi:hypothetical protein
VKARFEVRAPYARLIAATDGSGLGGMALVGAAQLARRTKAELYVFHPAGDCATSGMYPSHPLEGVTCWNPCCRN